MTVQIGILLALLLAALVLFSLERIPIEVVALLLVMALVLTNTLTPAEAFAGFGNDIVITIAGLFILTGGLARTGLIDLVGRRLHRTAGDSEFRIAALIMFAAALCAAVMKNTTTTAMFLPVVLGVARRRNILPSRLLGLNPRTFAITVTYAASCSFLTPLEPACVLVYTPGRYRFVDFLKVGSILTVAVFAIVIWLVPVFWPLK